VEKVAARRVDVKKKINALAAERESYLAAERKRLANGSADSTLAGAVVKTIQKQLAKSGFETARSPEYLRLRSVWTKETIYFAGDRNGMCRLSSRWQMR